VPDELPEEDAAVVPEEEDPDAWDEVVAPPVPWLLPEPQPAIAAATAKKGRCRMREEETQGSLPCQARSS